MRRSRKNPIVNTNLRIVPLINVGALLDIPTGNVITGPKGETFINGGLSTVEGITGLGNNFKSTIMHYMMLKVADRIEAGHPDLTYMHTYDTENNMLLNVNRYEELANKIFEYLPKNPIENGIWSIVTKADMPGNEWVKDVLYKMYEDKMNDKEMIVEFDCFINPSTKEPVKMHIPTFVEIDSLSEFEPDTTMDMLEKLDLEKTNTLFMQQGLFKSKVMKDIPRISNRANIYFLLTAHLGKKIDMSSSPYSRPTKDLQYLKQDEKIKGTTDKLNFLTTHLWKAHSSSALINQNTKLPEYPLYDDDVETDLNIVKLTQFRSKTGHSGYTLEILVSQNEGVLPTLTEFHYLKNNKFGIEGNPRSYWITLYPDVKLSRTTVRKKINEDDKLARAINILAELKQLTVFKPQLKDLFCTPEELYEDIKKLGYDWDVLLETRGWWAIKQYDNRIKPFLSTIDLLKMRKGEYVPYWIDEETKEVKKEYQKHFTKYNKEKKDGK